MTPPPPTVRHVDVYRFTWLQSLISGNSSEQHSQTNSYTTVGVSMLSVPLLQQYIGIVDYGLGFAPRPHTDAVRRVHTFF